MRSVGILCLGALLAVAGCKKDGANPTPSPAATSTAGVVRGVVTLAGPRPPANGIVPDVDVAVCGQAPLPERDLLVADNGGLSSAVVTLRPTGGQGVAVRVPAGATIEQGACQFHPFTVPIRVGGSITVSNSDPILHNVHVDVWKDGKPGESLNNVGQPAGAEPVTLKLDRVGAVRLDCDVHSWMRAFVWVTDAPLAAVTNERGGWALYDVPPGPYTLEVWHNWARPVTQSIEVRPGDQTVDVELKP